MASNVVNYGMVLLGGKKICLRLMHERRRTVNLGTPRDSTTGTTTTTTTTTTTATTTATTATITTTILLLLLLFVLLLLVNDRTFRISLDRLPEPEHGDAQLVVRFVVHHLTSTLVRP